MRRPARVEPRSSDYRLQSPPDPRFKAALLRVFEGHSLQRAVEQDRVQLGVFVRDRRAAEITMAEMEADPEAFRARFGGSTEGKR